MDDRIFTTSDSKNRYDSGLELLIVDKSCSEKNQWERLKIERWRAVAAGKPASLSFSSLASVD